MVFLFHLAKAGLKTSSQNLFDTDQFFGRSFADVVEQQDSGFKSFCRYNSTTDDSDDPFEFNETSAFSEQSPLVVNDGLEKQYTSFITGLERIDSQADGAEESVNGTIEKFSTPLKLPSQPQIDNSKTSDISQDANEKIIIYSRGKPISLGDVADSSLITSWSEIALCISRDAERGPTISARLYALVGSALYDTWTLFDNDALASSSGLKEIDNQIDIRYGKVSKCFADLGLDPEDQVSAVQEAFREVAMASAAACVAIEVGSSLYGNDNLPGHLCQKIQELLEVSKDKAELLRSSWQNRINISKALSLGKQVADVILEEASKDASNQQNNYADTTNYQPSPSVFNPDDPDSLIDSFWQPLQTPSGEPQDPLTPQWGKIKAFAVDNVESLLPNENDIVKPYNADNTVNQTFRDQAEDILNISMNLTAEDKLSAEYWESGDGSSYPPGRWMEFTNHLIQKNSLSLEEALKLSFGVSQAVHDAGIVSWNAKYKFNTVRPITSITQIYKHQIVSDWRNQEIPGNEWQPYQNPSSLSPPFPDWVSGHSTFSYAAATTITHILGTNVFHKTITALDSDSRFDSRGFDGNPDTNSTVSIGWKYSTDGAQDAGDSREAGGIHFEDGNYWGLRLGAHVGHFVSTKVDALFNGSELVDDDLQILVGTMGEDTLIGESLGIKIYGLSGDDIIQSERNDVQMFGGFGDDTFRLSNDIHSLIRDYQQEDDRIELLFDFAIEDLSTTMSGDGFTFLNWQDTKIATLDGMWSFDQLNFVT